MSINAQRATKFGGFYDKDVFEALGAYRNPVGATPPFVDADPYRCFLRETSLQRWLAYRTRCDVNDRKYKKLLLAQASAVIAVIGLLAVVMAALWT